MPSEMAAIQEEYQEEDPTVISDDEESVIVRHAFDGSRHVLHKPRDGTEEVNVTHYQDVLQGVADETSSLPEEYKLDHDGNRVERVNHYHTNYLMDDLGLSDREVQGSNGRKVPMPYYRTVEDNPLWKLKIDNSDQIEILAESQYQDDLDNIISPGFSRKQRYQSYITIFVAVVLAIAVLAMGSNSLSPYLPNSSDLVQYSEEEMKSRQLFPAGFGGTGQFGGGMGGLVAGKEREEQRRQYLNQYENYAPLPQNQEGVVGYRAQVQGAHNGSARQVGVGGTLRGG